MDYNGQMSNHSLTHNLQTYAQLIINTGLNLQPGQCLRLTAEVAHRDFVHMLVDEAYKAGSTYVAIEWVDEQVELSRLSHGPPETLDYFPPYEVTRFRQMTDEKWARLAIVGPEFPDIFDDVSPVKMRQISAGRHRNLGFYREAQMANHFQWCVAGAPTMAWAKQVFPESDEHEAYERLWHMILQTCRIDRADPKAAWDAHDKQLTRLTHFMDLNQILSIRFLDRGSTVDGLPATDLTVGLTAQPVWSGGASTTPDGVRFFPNMPTEEIFSTPHRLRVSGRTQTSKPTFPFGRKVENAWFEFLDGKVVEFGAKTGAETLGEFFQIDGTKHLGEVALVDIRSPINQVGRIFHEILFDENAVCHIAFGSAYREGLANSESLTAEQLQDAGVNQADAHLDVMIGTGTMDVIGTTADGREVTIMEQGKFKVLNGVG